MGKNPIHSHKHTRIQYIEIYVYIHIEREGEGERDGQEPCTSFGGTGGGGEVNSEPPSPLFMRRVLFQPTAPDQSGRGGTNVQLRAGEGLRPEGIARPLTP